MKKILTWERDDKGNQVKVIREVVAEDQVPSDTERLESWRSTASAARTDFCLALHRAGVLSGADAVEAARGNWPASMEGALSGLSDAEQDEAKIVWAGAMNIHRAHPLIAQLQTFTGLTDAQVDALFGWVVE